jgi:hypothetical protein
MEDVLTNIPDGPKSSVYANLLGFSVPNLNWSLLRNLLETLFSAIKTSSSQYLVCSKPLFFAESTFIKLYKLCPL